METQLTLAMMNDELGQARTSKKEFLNRIENIIPWTEFLKMKKTQKRMREPKLPHRFMWFI